LELRQGQAQFADGSAASAQGRFELEQKEIADGSLQLSGALARRWLPPGYSYEGLSLSGAFHGPLTNLEHSGRLELTNLTCPGVKPLQVQIAWGGTQTRFKSLELNAAAGHTSVLGRGSLVAEQSAVAVELTALSLLTNQQPALNLAQPCRLSVSRPEPGTQWRVDLTQLDLAGHAGEVHAHGALHWPNEGAFRVSAQGVSSALVAGFVRTNLPELEIQTLRASGQWTNGPAIVDLEFAATGRILQTNEQAHYALPSRAAVDLRVTADDHGLALSNLVVLSDGVAATSAKGFLPLTLHPADATNFVQLKPGQPMWLNASTEPKAFFWNTLAQWSGLRLREPELRAEVYGTWQEPQGQVKLRARSIQLEKAEGNMPALEDLQVLLKLERARASLVEGKLLVQGQAVEMTGGFPLGESFWAGLQEQQAPDWEQADVRLRIPNAELAPFAPLFPTLLTPQGNLDADIRWLPGGRLEGVLNLRQARTCPLAELGPIRDINLRLVFDERTVRLESATARVSSAPLEIQGQADLRGTAWLHGTMPPFQLKLSGTNVPLAREPEAIVRSDLQLAITKTNGAPPIITGLARLEDSYYLSDLSALIPGGVASVAQRPPYFSIDDPALADWRLAVDVQGARFLKVRSPLLNGEISANLRLQGTLKDPLALGDLKIETGVVRFPFASLDVRQGMVTLNSQDPYRPQLTASAASKQYGYDIRMQVSGTVDAPIIQFSSTPPLSSDQILLMVTAGELPQGNFTLTPQQRAQTVALFLGRDLLAKLGYGGETQPRLTIRSGQEVSEQGRQTYAVEYKISDRWSLVGDYDRFGDYNAGVKWRVYSK
jgi:translocation and assembly module TamB